MAERVLQAETEVRTVRLLKLCSLVPRPAPFSVTRTATEKSRGPGNEARNPTYLLASVAGSQPLTAQMLYICKSSRMEEEN